MEAATQFCWFMVFGKFGNSFAQLFHLPFTSLQEKISLGKFLYLDYKEFFPSFFLFLHLGLQFDSKQRGCHDDLKEQ